MKKQNIFIIILLSIIFIALFIYFFSNEFKENSIPLKAKILISGEKETIYDVIVAKTTLEQEKGLMYVEKLDKDKGMLFYYNESAKRSFWMKNTNISLDILFFDENFDLIKIYEDTKILNDEIFYSSVKPAKYVLEVNAGQVREHNIRIGDKLILF